MATRSKRRGILAGALWVAVVVTAFIPEAAWARGRARARCGRHTWEVSRGAVLVDGRRVDTDGAAVKILAAPSCRADGTALAWIERRGADTRLVVLPEMDRRAAPLPWPLPFAITTEQVFWASRTRVVVGPSMLAPRAVASWTEAL
jgi:hypothetical protein